MFLLFRPPLYSVNKQICIMTVRENVIVGLSNQRSMTSHTDNLSTHRTIGGTDSGLSSNVDSDLLSIAASCATLSGLSRYKLIGIYPALMA